MVAHPARLVRNHDSHGRDCDVGLFFWWKKCLPDFESSLYFAVVTYTTVGYGDLVLAKGWRLVAGVEALTGILMCGWSTGFFFIVASRLYVARLGPKQN